jgi:uncharacterized protein YcgI (DUF1989 family)
VRDVIAVRGISSRQWVESISLASGVPKMRTVDNFVLAARTGKAFRLARDAAVRVINTYGTQVVDMWAFLDADQTEFMSMEQTRLYLARLTPRVGDTLVTNRARPVLALTEDTSGGAHDTLLPACDKIRYARLGCKEKHDNCVANFKAALAHIGLHVSLVPAPLNLFENTAPDASGAISIKPPISQPGSYVTLRAEVNLVLVLSACPQDMALTNGPDRRPREVQVETLRAMTSDRMPKDGASMCQ